MVVKLRLYTTTELMDDCSGLMDVFHIKVERNLLEKFTDDGRYYDINSLDEFKKAVKNLKLKYEKYGKVVIIDKESLMKL